MGDDPEHGLSAALGIGTGSGVDLAEPDEAPDLFADRDLLRPVNFKGPKRPGRPKGARNKRTQEIADYILGRYRDPLIGLADIVSTPIPTLAHQLGTSKIKAAEFWRKCADTLALYVHQKQPAAVHVKSESVGFIGIVTDAQARAMEAGANPFAPGFAGVTVPAEKVEEKQDDSDDGAAPSHGEDVS